MRSRLRALCASSTSRSARWVVREGQCAHAQDAAAWPVDRLAQEVAVMAARLARFRDGSALGTRVSPEPHLRFDTNDRSVHGALVGRRVEVSVDQRHALPSAVLLAIASLSTAYY